MENYSSWKTPVLAGIAKAITKGVSAVLFSNHPITGIAVDEITSCGIDFIAGKLDSNNKNLHKTIYAYCEATVPPAHQHHMDIVCAAVEISLEMIDVDCAFHNSNAHNMACSLSAQYIDRYNAQFEAKTLQQIELYMPHILEEIILEISKQCENDPDFQISWKQYIASRLARVEQEQRQQSQQLQNLEQWRETQQRDSNSRISSVVELSEDYCDKWIDSLFLDENKTLKDVYQLPCYDDNRCDLHEKLQNTINYSNNPQCRMLVILGHPGYGKSSLITYFLNNCFIPSNRIVRVYRFSSFEDINWNSAIENLPQLMLNKAGLSKADLSGSVLILDGLDEVDMQGAQSDFLDTLYKQWAKAKSIIDFSLIVTCRTNRVDAPNELMSSHLTLCPLDSEQIKKFVQAYWGKCIEDFSSSELSVLQELSYEEMRNVMGIPLLLYMILALQIDIARGVQLDDVYAQIFSVESKNSIYLRSKYDNKHLITSLEANLIHTFSKEIAEKIWEFNPSEGTVTKLIYEPIANKIAGNGKEQLRKLLIGQYFMEGHRGCELLFVHRSMYEYFVALSIYDKIKHLVESRQLPEQLYDQMSSGNSLEELSTVADLIGLQSLPAYPEIQAFLHRLLTKDLIGTPQWWIAFFDLFTKEGLSDATTNRRKGGQKGIQEETNRFYNLIWLTREILRNSGVPAPFFIGDPTGLRLYLQIPSDAVKDLRELSLANVQLSFANLNDAKLSFATLSEANLTGSKLSYAELEHANLTSATLQWSDLSDANLSYAMLRNADLRNADLSGANLSNANLSNCDLRGANLERANLSNTRLVGAKLTGVNFSNAIFDKTDLSNSDMQNLCLANVTFSESILCRANLENSDLSNADLYCCDISYANLNNAVLDEADLRKSNLTSAQFYSALLINSYLQGATLDKASFDHADLGGVDLSSAHLRGTSLRGANLSNAILFAAELIEVDLCDAELLNVDLNNAKLTRVRMNEGCLDRTICSKEDISSWGIIYSTPDTLSRENILYYDDWDYMDNWDILDPVFDNYWYQV